MKDGQVAEYDSPTVLMENESTIFHSLCKDAKLCWLLLCSATYLIKLVLTLDFE